jgi:glycosyltransferase involved in cell wall biosynthesis
VTKEQTRPTISIVIPAFNAGSVIASTLNSILAQDIEPDEILVVDDGSTDSTREVVKGFGNRVKLISQNNEGAASARYTGVLNARYDIIIFCDSGDHSNPYKIRILREGFIKYPDAVACFGAQWNRTDSKPISSRWTNSYLDGSYHLIPDPLTIMLSRPGPFAWVMDISIRRDVALESLKIPNFYIGANDYAAQLRASTHGQFVHVASITTEFELLPGGLSSTLGLDVQYAYSLCAAAETYESTNRRKNHLTILRKRVNQSLPQGLLVAYQSKRWPLFRRLIKIQLKYGSTKSFIRRFWWALKNSERDGNLNNFPVLRSITRVGLSLKKLI